MSEGGKGSALHPLSGEREWRSGEGLVGTVAMMMMTMVMMMVIG